MPDNKKQGRSNKTMTFFVCFLAALAGLLFGLDIGVIAGALPFIANEFQISAHTQEWVVSSMMFGAAVGAVGSGWLSFKLGRKKSLMIGAILFVAGSLFSAAAPNVEVLLLSRVLLGLAVGVASYTAPLYLSEIAPEKIRGSMISMYQLMITIGILGAYLSDTAFSYSGAWRWMLGVMVVPAVLFLVMLPTGPETPRWLAGHGDLAAARATSERLCSTPAEADAQMAEIQETLAAEQGTEKTKFYTRGHRKVILLAVAIAFFNQMSGINAILYYAPRVMQDAGASTNAAYLMSVAVGVMNLVATMAALTVIDRLGRRRLMLVGSVGYLVSLGFMASVMFYYESDGRSFDSTSSILVLLGLMVFIASHAFGQGAVIWVFLSEIFPNSIRGRGQALGSLTHWVWAAITSFAFPPIIGAFGGGVAFSIFFGFMVLQLLWVIKAMPETKGIPLEEMAERLGGGRAAFVGDSRYDVAAARAAGGASHGRASARARATVTRAREPRGEAPISAAACSRAARSAEPVRSTSAPAAAMARASSSTAATPEASSLAPYITTPSGRTPMWSRCALIRITPAEGSLPCR